MASAFLCALILLFHFAPMGLSEPADNAGDGAAPEAE